MYWSTHYGGGHNFDAIYEKGVEGIDDLLDSDSVIMKARNGDEKLMIFLTRADIMPRLIDYSLGLQLDGEKRVRYPLIACELLCGENQKVQAAISRDIHGVWRIPEANKSQKGYDRNQQQSLHQLVLGWVRLMNHLIVKLPGRLVDSLLLQEDFIERVLNNLARSEVLELVCRLISLSSGGDGQDVLTYFREGGFFKTLIGMLSPQYETEYHTTIQAFIMNLLTFTFPDTFAFDDLLEIILSELKGVLENSIVKDCPVTEVDKNLFGILADIVGNLAMRISLLPHNNNNGDGEFEGLNTQFASIVLPVIPHLQGYLAPRKKNLPPYTSPAGILNPLGIVRLKTARLFADLTILQQPEIITEITRSNTASDLLELFFLHQFNNILHASVEDFLRHVFSGQIERNLPLILSIFKDGRLLHRIVKTQRINDAAMQRPRGTRLSHMGHITLLTDMFLNLFQEHGDTLKIHLQKEMEHEDWREYCAISYKETKSKDNQVLGGSKAPSQPPEESPEPPINSFTGLFTSGTDEQLARYFCQQVISHLPNRFIFTDGDGDQKGEGDDDVDVWRHDDNDYNEDEEVCFEEEASIEIPMEPNGLEDSLLLEMEMRFSSLANDNPSAGSGSGSDYEESSEDERDNKYYTDGDDGYVPIGRDNQ